jgi:tetratricopeptide (TPR) repeat protein
MREVLARPALPRSGTGGDASLAAALSALGYARGAEAPELPSPLEPSERPSPRSRRFELEPLLRAHALFEAGRFAECLPLAEELVRSNPRHLLALDLATVCRMHAGEFARAEELARQRLALGEVADARLNLGLCRLELGDPEGARAEIEAALARAPGQPEILAALERLGAEPPGLEGPREAPEPGNPP